MMTSLRYASLRPYIDTWRRGVSWSCKEGAGHLPPTSRGQLQSKMFLDPRATLLTLAAPSLKPAIRHFMQNEKVHLAQVERVNRASNAKIQAYALSFTAHWLSSKNHELQ